MDKGGERRDEWKKRLVAKRDNYVSWLWSQRQHRKPFRPRVYAKYQPEWRWDLMVNVDAPGPNLKNVRPKSG